MVSQRLTGGWETPRTWAEQYLRSPHINTELQVRALHLYAPPIYSWELNEPQPVGSGRWTTIRWTKRNLGSTAWEEQDPGSTWTAPIGGAWLVATSVGSADTTHTGDRGVEILHNDRPLTGALGPCAGTGVSWGTPVTGLFLMDAADTIEVQAFQSSGDQVMVGNEDPRTSLTIAWLGDPFA